MTNLSATLRRLFWDKHFPYPKPVDTDKCDPVRSKITLCILTDRDNQRISQFWQLSATLRRLFWDKHFPYPDSVNTNKCGLVRSKITMCLLTARDKQRLSQFWQLSATLRRLFLGKHFPYPRPVDTDCGTVVYSPNLQTQDNSPSSLIQQFETVRINRAPRMCNGYPSNVNGEIRSDKRKVSALNVEEGFSGGNMHEGKGWICIRAAEAAG
ncbi:hypothetical protein J6590_016496 [Homalodisca vitripennis]|nr:hypothetical protein J6590_016496 [Homalodisca vitripennis]